MNAAVRREIPVFPLNTVLFPGGVLPLRVFEARYVDMTRDCMKREQPFGVALIKEGAEVGAAAVAETVGCTARITDWDMQQLGVLNITTVGQERYRMLTNRVAANGLITAEVEAIAAGPSQPVPGASQVCVTLLRAILAQIDARHVPPPHHFNDAAWVGYRLSELLPIQRAAKQKLLELEDSLSRLEIITKYLEQNGLAIKK
jgi:Lon protease-like protein